MACTAACNIVTRKGFRDVRSFGEGQEAIARHFPAACRQAMVRLEVCRRMSAQPAEALGRLFFVHAAELRFVYSNLGLP
jgi:hypothetical protein